MRLIILLLCIVASAAFTTPQCAVSSSITTYPRLVSSTAKRNVVVQSSRLINKPHTSLEARLNGDDEEVKVVEMDVDAFTLTAVGFGLIAFNFLVLANVSIMVLFSYQFITRLQDPNFNTCTKFGMCFMPPNFI
jgi:hypothetical protein